MRLKLADLICQSAIDDPKFVVLSGDHGYALFDRIRSERPKQFINAGVAEQAMVGLAAGLTRMGFKTLVYGLAAFVPTRVLEQIKLDICFSGLPVTFLGDGGGVVYSTLGASHHSAEDIACLRPMPGLRIYSPADIAEVEACYGEAIRAPGPAYIRIGKSDRPRIHPAPVTGTDFRFTETSPGSRVCLVGTGSLASPAAVIAKKLGLNALSVPRIKPLSDALVERLYDFDLVVTFEEASLAGGLYSSLAEAFVRRARAHPLIHPIALEEKFAERCGSYQYALSEHSMSDDQLIDRVRDFLSEFENYPGPEKSVLAREYGTADKPNRPTR